MQTTKETTKTKRASKHPKWWKDDHDSAWERVKAAFKRDWDQTTGEELDQDVGDTVKQAMGKQAIPPRHVPNPPDADERWEDIEDGFRFGHGARAHYGEEHPEWDDKLEAKLRNDWDTTEPRADWARRSWHIRRAYEQPPVI